MIELAKNCRECEFYVPTHQRTTGVCSRAGDTGPAYVVLAEQKVCNYRESGMRISPDVIERKQEEADRNHENALRSYERAGRIIDGWPPWMRSIADKLLR